MAADIDRVVEVVISRNTVVPTMAAFNYPLLAGEFLASAVTPAMGATERVRYYTSLAEMATAGFTDATAIGKAAIKMFAQGNPPRVYVGRKLTGADGTETWTQALTAIALENKDWYGLIAMDRVLANQKLIADWVEANGKLCVLGSGDANIPDDTTSPDEIATYIKDASLDRSAVIYHPDVGGVSENYIDAAWMALMFGKAPGSATWAFKTLKTLLPATLTGVQITNILAKYASLYSAISGISMTQNGRVGSGDYLDIIHGLDWLKAKIQQKVFTPLVQLPKVPFTDAGIAVVTGQVKSALQDAVDIALLNEGFTVSAPKAADVDAGDKANRLLPDVTFTAILSGAVHKVQVNGVVEL